MDPNVIHKVETANAQNLFNMWTGKLTHSVLVQPGLVLTLPVVFSRYAEFVEQGRRLENLRWRLWNRETFCCDATEGKLRQAKSTTPVASTAPGDILDVRIP